MNVRIKNWNELQVLKQVNPLLGSNEIPLEVLWWAEQLLDNKDLGRNGYIYIILTPIQEDVKDILDEVNLDYTVVEIPDNNIYQIDIKNKEHPLNKNRRWCSYDLVYLNRSGKVYAIYSMKTVGD